MRLSMFREKLAYEINKVETIIQNSEYPNQEVQTHTYCIAALLRKIMTRLTDFREYKIPLRSPNIEGEEDISLKDLVDRVLHYTLFLPSDPISSPKTLNYIQILSDKDEDSTFRRVDLTHFIRIAKQIAEDDDAIQNNLLNHTRVRLKQIIKAPDIGRFNEIQTMDSLIDFFELARKTGNENWPSGRITLFKENRDFTGGIENMKITGVHTCKINYEILRQRLFKEWQLMPFRQFRLYWGTFDELESHKIIELLNYGGENSYPDFEGSTSDSFIIRMKDLFNLLCAIQY